MLRWRLLLGVLFVLILVALFWIDHLIESTASVSGVVLILLALLCVGATTREVLDLLEAGGIRPLRWVVHLGNQFILLVSWTACFAVHTRPYVTIGEKLADRGCQWPSPSGWMLLALAAGVILAFVAEMHRFQKPGGVTINLSGAVFTMTYVGVMLGFLVLIRMGWGVMAVASVIVVVKMTDTGAYTIGRLFGRNKMAPGLSPGKTIEGAVGGLVFACFGSWLVFYLMEAETSVLGWITYGLLVGMAGMAGDLAESLIKRDVEKKDSSLWMPGFGGVLDILDSILLAAPVSYALWAFGIVG